MCLFIIADAARRYMFFSFAVSSIKGYYMLDRARGGGDDDGANGVVGGADGTPMAEMHGHERGSE